MYRALKERDLRPELMDDFSKGGEDLREALRHLRRLNRVFRAAAPTLYGVRRLWEATGRPRTFTVLDAGAGSGDVNRRLLGWAEASGIDMRITLADITQEACDEAAAFFRDEPRIEVRRCNVLSLEEGCADVVTGSQFLHHFDRAELPGVVGRMLKGARHGVVINDIHRHWIPWSAVWVAARVLSRNRYIRHDGPLSVAKGFRSADWEYLKEQLGAESFHYTWVPLFRYAVVIGKASASQADWSVPR
ncbi:chalcone and stilbene synthase domain-containing protein [Paenibacillus mucilaginosus 3016]|uniref:Chalcone and stilbene synthase domain-containing protein n=1 Tax=Paenibacillus mucilaginosus 3016 TaxID=1116391 RepID=H6NFX4_9BACL|nr:methyltransferase domain-containing protein [Paenibacillus mucilaginosus]AFC31393.1 chalcone and stilbene synthase domain-containing protein [Paenibacillus mucilaginosus 3016]WFA19945.1 methyltransferase domain-containing protein [Paenibacillus mucilaginosus]